MAAVQDVGRRNSSNPVFTITAEQVERFRKLIQCETVTNSDPSEVNWSAFDALHTVFKAQYPMIYEHFHLTDIGEAGLQFYYEAPNPTAAPLLLMSHQDVVEPGDLAQWEEAPFSAVHKEGLIWGRGTTDCKHVVFAELEAVESLLLSGWRPTYDVYISLGYSEEVYRIDGADGGRLLAENLEAQGITLGCLIDEGGRIEKTPNGQCAAYIGLGEKSAVNFELLCHTDGGHSSKPGKGTGLGQIARAIVAIEEHPLPYRLTPLVKAHLQASAALQEGERAKIYADPEGHWEALCELARGDVELDAMLHTTFAVTMASGSAQPNVMPSHATTGISCRILQGDTVESIISYLERIIPKTVSVRHISGVDPQPTATVESKEYALLAKTVQHIYGDDTYVIPYLMLGATDSRYYKNVAPNAFRFSGFFQDERWGKAHCVNERIPVDALGSGIQYFKEILKAYGETIGF
ncbi:M20/M25/M40 family metallo-hydrolase [uncultured Veillonella sp.]|uniref:M20/M25/M40 family metallo-hydrolase n=1 Tax=uncultured Veillonella sp. TaxID=159268 RepID=UPI002610F60F|nr:M20/M25/M40 family metallo-hydrolase [uncultured Veillonella sp.]